MTATLASGRLMIWAAIAAVSAALAVGLEGHDLGRSESVVTVRGSEVRARVTLDLLEVAGIDISGDGRVSYGELDEEIDRIYAIVKGHLTIRSVTPPVRSALEHYAVRDEHVGELDLLLTFDRRVSGLTVTSTLHQILRPAHEHLTSVSFDGTPGVRRAVLNAGMPGAEFGQGSNSYPATVVLGLLAGTVIACVAVVQFVRRAFIR